MYLSYNLLLLTCQGVLRGTTLGLGEKKVAVPVEQLRQDNDNGVILMSEKTESELANMPAWEEGSDLYEPYTGKGENPWKTSQ